MHPPLFGQLMSMFLLVHFFLITRRIALGWRMALGASMGLSFLGIFYAYTRGPWVATVLAVVVLAVLRPRFRMVVAVLVILALLGRKPISRARPFLSCPTCSCPRW